MQPSVGRHTSRPIRKARGGPRRRRDTRRHRRESTKPPNPQAGRRDATTEAPTTAQTFEPTAAPESDAADRVALGAVAVTLLALVA